MIGLDVIVAVEKSLFKNLDNSTEPPASRIAKVERGELGVKSGKGYYDYTGKSRAQILEEQNKKLLRQLTVFNLLEENK